MIEKQANWNVQSQETEIHVTFNPNPNTVGPQLSGYLYYPAMILQGILSIFQSSFPKQKQSF